MAARKCAELGGGLTGVWGRAPAGFVDGGGLVDVVVVVVGAAVVEVTATVVGVVVVLVRTGRTVELEAAALEQAERSTAPTSTPARGPAERCHVPRTGRNLPIDDE